MEIIIATICAWVLIKSFFNLRLRDREHKLKCNRTLIKDFKNETPERIDAIGKAIKNINSTPEIKMIDPFRNSKTLP